MFGPFSLVKLFFASLEQSSLLRDGTFWDLVTVDLSTTTLVSQRTLLLALISSCWGLGLNSEMLIDAQLLLGWGDFLASNDLNFVFSDRDFSRLPKVSHVACLPFFILISQFSACGNLFAFRLHVFGKFAKFWLKLGFSTIEFFMLQMGLGRCLNLLV